MSGYNWGAGISNGAVDAYERGLRPASKTGVPAALVREFCTPCEWHNTSKMFNDTDFYDPKAVRATFGLEVGEDLEADTGAVRALAQWKAARNAERKSQERIYENQDVKWFEWSRRRKRSCRATGARGAVKGRTATVTFADGRVRRWRLDTNGFSFSPPAPPEPTTFGGWVAWLRYPVSLETFAENVELPVSALAEIEADRAPVDHETILCIARGLGWDGPGRCDLEAALSKMRTELDGGEPRDSGGASVNRTATDSRGSP